MRVFNTICKKCGKETDEEMTECLSCGSKAIYYQADLTKRELSLLTGGKEK